MKQKRWMTAAITTAKAPLPALPWQRGARQPTAVPGAAATDSLSATPRKTIPSRSIRSA